MTTGFSFAAAASSETPKRFLAGDLKNPAFATSNRPSFTRKSMKVDTLDALVSQLNSIHKNQDATDLCTFFEDSNERISEVKGLSTQFKSPQARKSMEKSMESLGLDNYVKTLLGFLTFALETNLDDPVARHDAIAVYFENYSGQVFGGGDGAMWHVPCLKSMARTLTDSAWKADKHLLKLRQRPNRANALSRYLQPTFRYAIPPHRRPALLWISNLSFRNYLRLGSLTLCDNMLTGLSTANVNVSEFSKADQVEFRYWMGRIRLMQYYFRPAEENFEEALNRCIDSQSSLATTKSQRNLKQIVLYLTIAKLVLGQIPNQQLVQRHGLSSLFPPEMMQAWTVGNFKVFFDCVDRNAKFWMKCGVYTVLKQRTKVLLFRNLFKRAFVFGHSVSDKGTPTISLSQLVVACRVAGLDFSDMDVEGTVASLIQQGYIKGYIHHEKAVLVVMKDGGLWKKAFPHPSTIQSTQGETMIKIR